MKQKKWVIRFVLSLALIYGFFSVTYYIVNPEFYYDNNLMIKNKIGYDSSFIKKLREKLNEKNYSLIFGTSRSHTLQKNIIGEDTLNMHAIYGNPYSVYEFLTNLNRNQLENINKIYYTVDLHTFNGKDSYKYIDYSNAENKSIIKVLNIKDFLAIHASFFSDGYISELGHKILDSDKSISVNFHKYDKSHLPQKFTEDAIAVFKKIVSFSRLNKIPLVITTPSFSADMLKHIDMKLLYSKWKKILATGLEGFYALWYVDGVSNQIIDNKYVAFYDTTHMNYKFQKKIFEEFVLNDNKKYFIKNEFDLNNLIREIKTKIGQPSTQSMSF